MRSLINSQINRIRPLNPVMLELLNSLNNKHSEVADLKRIIETDANTAATILKIANSPFYGLSGRIKCVQDACVLLGYDQLKNIIYTTALEQATDKGPHIVWRTMLREHTKLSGIVAAHLVAKSDLQGIASSDGYAAGLLHKLGKQIVLAEFPELFENYMNSKSDMENYTEIFLQVGKQVAERWYLPPLLCAAVEFARMPERAPEIFYPIVRIVNAAHGIASSLGYPSPGDKQVYEAEPLLLSLNLQQDCLEVLQQLKALRDTQL